MVLFIIGAYVAIQSVVAGLLFAKRADNKRHPGDALVAWCQSIVWPLLAFGTIGIRIHKALAERKLERLTRPEGLPRAQLMSGGTQPCGDVECPSCVVEERRKNK